MFSFWPECFSRKLPAAVPLKFFIKVFYLLIFRVQTALKSLTQREMSTYLHQGIRLPIFTFPFIEIYP